MKKIAPGKETLSGLDISHYDGRVDLKMVKLSGREFVIQKCTEYVVDNTFAYNRKAAKDANILFGSYHFFHASKDPLAQAHTFLNYALPQKGELIPTLDWEVTDGVDYATEKQRAKVWLDTVEKACGKPPTIYSSPYFLDALKLGPEFARYPLWIAHYGTSAPLVPGPWQNWVFWQFSEKGNVPGIPAPDEDLDIFNGNLTQLKLLTL